MVMNACAMCMCAERARAAATLSVASCSGSSTIYDNLIDLLFVRDQKNENCITLGFSLEYFFALQPAILFQCEQNYCPSQQPMVVFPSSSNAFSNNAVFLLPGIKIVSMYILHINIYFLEYMNILTCTLER